MKARRASRFQGVGQIIRYNYGQYISGIVTVIALLTVALSIVPLLNLTEMISHLLSLALIAGGALAAWWLIASLAASWWIYDLSPLRRWIWLYNIASPVSKKWVLVHTGLDECGHIFRENFPGSAGLILDTYHEHTMTEPSIRRARAMETRKPDSRCHWAHWPLPANSMDLVYFILSAHELRDNTDRVALFQEARRCLKPQGRLILVEHKRDLANFLAFGPGFLHFWPARVWDTTARQAGLNLTQQKTIAGFLTLREYQQGAPQCPSSL